MYKIEELFVISSKISGVNNDTDQIQIYKNEKLNPGALKAFKTEDGHKLTGRMLRLSSVKSEICIKPFDVLKTLEIKLKDMPEGINFLDYHYNSSGFKEKKKFLQFVKEYIIVFGCEAEPSLINLKSYESILRSWVKRKVINRVYGRGLCSLAIGMISYASAYFLLKHNAYQMIPRLSLFFVPFLSLLAYKYLDKDSVY